MNLPNKLTIFRILLVPLMVIIPFLNIKGTLLNIPIAYLIINLIFIIAAITDKLDRRYSKKNKSNYYIW